VGLDTVSSVSEEPSTDAHRRSSLRYRTPLLFCWYQMPRVSTRAPLLSSTHTATYGLFTRPPDAAGLYVKRTPMSPETVEGAAVVLGSVLAGWVLAGWVLVGWEVVGCCGLVVAPDVGGAVVARDVVPGVLEAGAAEAAGPRAKTSASL